MAAVLFIGLCCNPAVAQQTGSVNMSAGSSSTLPAPNDLDAKKDELRQIEGDISASEAQRRKVQADIEEIRTDRVRLNAALIEATDKVQAAEAKVAAIENRLDTLAGSEEAIKHSLVSRRGTIAEVLAVLQRMGRKPLPAILVSPQDMLLAIRTSMLLGAVVPELRNETEALASDLSDLTHINASILADRDTLSQETADLSKNRPA